MANPRPTPKPENLRPPWPPGTSGNPAGYSRVRRISDAIESQIEEKALDREFGATAIAMALGKKSMLKHKVKDPETGEDIWVERKPDIAWFNLILERIEPVANHTDDQGHRIKIGGLGRMANPAFGENLGFCGTFSHLSTMFVVALVIVNKYNVHVQ